MLCGCGHQASLEECELIVTRITELEVAEHGRDASAESVQEQVAETKQAMHQKTLQNCVGKRITEGALDCVRSAKSSDEIINRCLD